MSNNPSPPPSNLTTGAQGELLKSPEEAAKRCHDFLKTKFSETEAEKVRPPMEPIPETRTEEDCLTRDEFDQVVDRLNSNKATGPDDIPAEVYKHCPLVRDELFLLVKYI